MPKNTRCSSTTVTIIFKLLLHVQDTEINCSCVLAWNCCHYCAMTKWRTHKSKGGPCWKSQRVRITSSQSDSGTRVKLLTLRHSTDMFIDQSVQEKQSQTHRESSHSGWGGWGCAERGQVSKQADGLDCLDSRPLVSHQPKR